MLVKPSSTSPLPNEPVFRLNVKFWEICSKGSCWKIFCSCTALLKHEHLYSHMISKEFPDPKSCFFWVLEFWICLGFLLGILNIPSIQTCVLSIHLLQVLLYRVTVATRMTFPQRYKNPRQMVCSTTTTTTTYTSAKTNMSPEK